MKMHKSHDELRSEMEAALKQVKIGQKYAHFKHPDGDVYGVVMLAYLEATDEVAVLYKSMNNGMTWIRPFKSFIGEVEVEGKKMKRFQLA